MPSDSTVVLLGHLTREPKTRTVNTKNGEKMVSNMTVALDQYGKDEAAFVDITTWGKSAEFSVDWGKGDLIYARGNLAMDRWEMDDGTRRQKVLVNAQFAAKTRAAYKSGGDSKPQETPQPSEPDQKSEEDDLPF